MFGVSNYDDSFRCVGCGGQIFTLAQTGRLIVELFSHENLCGSQSTKFQNNSAARMIMAGRGDGEAIVGVVL
ncbi:MAG: hypothetical protein ACKOPC_06295 [Methylocystis sp.]